jgi:hypothetical protein
MAVSFFGENDKNHKSMMKYNLLLILNRWKMPLMTNSHSKDICGSGNKCQLNNYVTSLKPNRNLPMFQLKIMVISGQCFHRLNTLKTP